MSAEMQIQRDPVIMSALERLTGSPVIQVRTGIGDDGKDIYADGYQITTLVSPVPGEPAQSAYHFHNNKGQDTYVPGHRVREVTKTAKVTP